MAVNIIALMGNVTRAETARKLGVDLKDWKLRKSDPRTPGSSHKGKADRRRGYFILACATLMDLQIASELLGHEGYASKLVVFIKESNRLDRVNVSAMQDLAGVEATVSVSEQSMVIILSANQSSIDISLVARLVGRYGAENLSSLRVAVDDISMVGLLTTVGQPGHAGVGVESLSQAPDSISPIDIYVKTDDVSAQNPVAGAMRLDDGPVVITAPSDLVFGINTMWVNPIGFMVEPERGTAVLTFSVEKKRLYLKVNDSVFTSAEFEITHGFSELLIDLLHKYRSVELLNESFLEENSLTKLVRNLACAGIPLVLKSEILEREFIAHKEVLSQLRKLNSFVLSDNLRRQAWSVTLRRVALTNHSLAGGWTSTLDKHGISSLCSDSTSVIVASRRPELLPRILEQIGHQTFANIEVHVGMHGFGHNELDGYKPNIVGSVDVHCHLFNRSMRLGAVLNELSVRSSGRFITKMDDDDWYSRHHVGDLLLAKEYSGAHLVGSKAEYVYLESADKTIQRRPNSERFGASVTGELFFSRKRHYFRLGGGVTCPQQRTGCCSKALCGTAETFTVCMDSTM